MKKRKSVFQTPVLFQFLLIATILFCYGCHKNSKADFTFEAKEYSAGDLIALTNLSIDSKTYKWTFQDEGLENELIESTETNPVHRINLFAPDGNYVMNLTAFSSKKEKVEKSTTITKSILLKTTRGYLNIYAPSDSKITCYIDNQLVEKTSYGGVLQVSVPIGKRFVSVQTTTHNGDQTETVNIVSGNAYYMFVD